MRRDLLDYDALMRHARNPDDVLAQTFARVMVAAARGTLAAPGVGMGLDRTRFGALVDCYFPGAGVQLFGARCDPAAPCADCTPVPLDTTAFHSTMISAPFSFGSQPQKRPQLSSAHKPPSTVPTKLKKMPKHSVP